MNLKTTINGVAFCLITLMLGGCGGAEEREADHLAKAVKYFEQANMEKAAVEFKNVLQIDPKVSKPYYYLGRIEEGKKNWGVAFGFYQKAVELDPNNRDAQLKLAQFYLLANDPNKATELLEPVAKEKPDDIEVQLLQVAIAGRKGDREAALSLAKKIVEGKPKRPEPYIVLAAFYIDQTKMKEAEQSLKDGLAVNPKNVDLLNSLTRLYMQQKQAEPAENTIKELIEAQPTQLNHRVQLAQLYMLLGRYDDVENTLRAAMQDFPSDPVPPTVLADFFIKRGDVAKAEGELKSAIAKNPGEANLHFALAQLLEGTKRPDEAEKVYRDFISATESKPDALKAKNRLAALLTRRGRPDETEELLKEILAENAQDHDALLLQAKLALNGKKPQDAIASLRSILKDQPDSTEVLTLLASAYQMDGKPALAQENLEKAVLAKPDDFGLRKNLVEFLIGQKNYELALEKANDFLKLKPKSLDGLGLKAEVYVGSQQLVPLESVLKEISSNFPDNPIGPYRLGGLYAAQKKYDEAVTELELAIKRSKEDYDPLKAIMTIYIQMKQPEKAFARIKKALADDPKNAGAYQLLAAYEMNQNRREEAVKALKSAIEANPRWLLPYFNLASLYEKKGDFDQAIAINRKAMEASPNDPAARMNVARIYENRKEYSKAIEQYEELLKSYPDNLVAMNNLAALLSIDTADKKRQDRAFELAKRLESTGQPAFLDTLSWIYYLRGDLDKALPLQQKATENLKDSPVLQYHLGMIYLKKGESAKAREHLEKAVQAKNDFIGLQEAKDALKTLQTGK